MGPIEKWSGKDRKANSVVSSQIACHDAFIAGQGPARLMAAMTFAYDPLGTIIAPDLDGRWLNALSRSHRKSLIASSWHHIESSSLSYVGACQHRSLPNEFLEQYSQRTHPCGVCGICRGTPAPMSSDNRGTPHAV